MNKRIIVCGLALLVLVAGLPAISPSTAQDYPTANAATIDAMVQQRFESTRNYEAFGTLNVTIDAAFAQAQTATAAAPTIAPTATLLAPTGTILAGTNVIPTPSPIVTTNPVDTIAPELVFIPGNDSFQMGTTFAEVAQAVNQCTIEEQGNCTVDMAQDSMPAHTVKIAPFQMQRSEVTASQYAAFLNLRGAGSHLNGCEGNPCALTRVEDENALIGYDGKVYDDLGGRLPMYKVTWYGAKAFCEASGARLPTEAEWEYAARGTDGRIYPWGNVWDPLSARTSIPVTTEVGPLPVDSYPSGLSPFGLFDMAGNVAEWVSDWYDPVFYSSADASLPNPTGPTAGTEKVIRGGSWDAKPFFARSVHRQSMPPTNSGSWVGFRCAADAPAVLPTLSPTRAPTQATLPATMQVTLIASPTALPSDTQPTLTATAAG